jgi:hypothetical protein
MLNIRKIIDSVKDEEEIFKGNHMRPRKLKTGWFRPG